jgi:hypothetical protein
VGGGGNAQRFRRLPRGGRACLRAGAAGWGHLGTAWEVRIRRSNSGSSSGRAVTQTAGRPPPRLCVIRGFRARLAVCRACGSVRPPSSPRPLLRARRAALRDLPALRSRPPMLRPPVLRGRHRAVDDLPRARRASAAPGGATARVPRAGRTTGTARGSAASGGEPPPWRIGVPRRPPRETASVLSRRSPCRRRCPSRRSPVHARPRRASCCAASPATRPPAGSTAGRGVASRSGDAPGGHDVPRRRS